MAAISQIPMPLPMADIATAWAFLEEGLDYIMTNTDVSYAKYMSLYAVAHNCVICAKYVSLYAIAHNCASSETHSSTSSKLSAARRCLPFIFVPWSIANILIF